MSVREIGALAEVAVGVALAAGALVATYGGVVPHRFRPRRAQAAALAGLGLAFAVWGVGEGLPGREGSVVQLCGVGLLLAACAALAATTPPDEP